MKKITRVWCMSLALGSAIIVCHADDPKPLDILGLQPGMSAEDALKKLESLEPKLEIERAELKFAAFGDQPVLHALYAYRMTEGVVTDWPAESVQVHFTLPPNKPQVWKIGRTLRYPQGEEISKSGLVKALLDKYGPPTLSETKATATPGYWWAFDEQGKLVEGVPGRHCVTYFRACRSLTTLIQQPGQAARSSGMALEAVQYPQQFPVNVQQGFTKSYVSAMMALTGNESEFVRLIQVIMSDAALFNRATDVTRATLVNAAEKAEKEKLEKAKQREMPKL